MASDYVFFTIDQDEKHPYESEPKHESKIFLHRTTSTRLFYLLAFSILEVLWLILALIIHNHVIQISSDTTLQMLGITISRITLFKSTLSAFAILWQIIAIIPITNIILEAFSCEWLYILTHSNHDKQDYKLVNSVSTITSGYLNWMSHTFSSHSSWRYRTAFVVSTLVILSQVIAPGSIIISSYSQPSNILLPIGILPSNRTYISFNESLNANDSSNRRELLLTAAYLVDSLKSDRSVISFVSNTNNTLFGVTSHAVISEHLTYQTLAVAYDFECKWIAPLSQDRVTGIEDIIHIGPDVIGIQDPDSSSAVNKNLLSLVLTSGPGSNNGSFALFIAGGNSSSPLDLSSIPETNRTFNEDGWTESEVDSTIASILFCDPHMEFGIVDVDLRQRAFNSEIALDTNLIGYAISDFLDPDETSRMLGTSLNVAIQDTNLLNLTGLSEAFLSQTGYEFIFLPPSNSGGSSSLQTLANISNTLNWFTTLIGQNVFLDGTLGTKNISAIRTTNIYRFDIDWVKFLVTSIVCLSIIALTATLIFLNYRSPEYMFPLSVAGIAAVLSNDSYCDERATLLGPLPLSSIPDPDLTGTLSRNGRIIRILAFFLLEIAWIVLGFATQFWSLRTSSFDTMLMQTSYHSESNSLTIQSILSELAIIWQAFTALPIAAIFLETFSGEFEYLLASGERLYVADTVSTLTSGLYDQFQHFFRNKASRRFKMAFVVSMSLLVLKVVAPGAVTVGVVTTFTNEPISVGTLPVNVRTDYFFLQKSIRFSYLEMIKHATLGYKINTNNTLVGLPLPILLSDSLAYTSDAISYDYECQWAAPSLISLPEDDEFNMSEWNVIITIDGSPKSYNLTVSCILCNGIMKLTSSEGGGSMFGSLAWLVAGGDVLPAIDLSSIPDSRKTYNESGWIAFDSFVTRYNPSWSTTLSVLFCDPHMQFRTADVLTKGQNFFVNTSQDSRPLIGNLDPNSATVMLETMLSYISDDGIYANVTALGSQVISSTAFELVFEPSKDDIGAVKPQLLSNISSTLNWLTTTLGSNLYLDGSLNNTVVSARRMNEVEQLVCSWFQWALTVVSMAVVIALLIFLCYLERPGTPAVTPFTLETIMGTLKEKSKEDIFHDISG